MTVKDEIIEIYLRMGQENNNYVLNLSQIFAKMIQEFGYDKNCKHNLGWKVSLKLFINY